MNLGDRSADEGQSGSGRGVLPCAAGGRDVPHVRGGKPRRRRGRRGGCQPRQQRLVCVGIRFAHARVVAGQQIVGGPVDAGAGKVALDAATVGGRQRPDGEAGGAKLADALGGARAELQLGELVHQPGQVVSGRELAGVGDAGKVQHAEEQRLHQRAKRLVSPGQAQVRVLALCRLDPEGAQQRGLYSLCPQPVAQPLVDGLPQVVIADERAHNVEDNVLVGRYGGGGHGC